MFKKLSWLKENTQIWQKVQWWYQADEFGKQCLIKFKLLDNYSRLKRQSLCPTPFNQDGHVTCLSQ